MKNHAYCEHRLAAEASKTLIKRELKRKHPTELTKEIK